MVETHVGGEVRKVAISVNAEGHRKILGIQSNQGGIKSKISIRQSIHETIHALRFTKINVRNLTDAT